MNHKEHNGWYNYETWLVNLWLTNEPATYDELSTIVKQDLEVYEKADHVKNMVEDLVHDEDEPAGLKTDLVGAAMQEVNWQEIVENHLED